MTLIKCPSCNHTILGLASRCPNCGLHLTQLRFQQGLAGSLAECRKCGRKVLSKTRRCPYCGAQHPATTGRVVMTLGALGIVAALILLVLARQLQPRPQIPDTSTGTVPETPAGVEDLPMPAPAEPSAEAIAAPLEESPSEVARSAPGTQAPSSAPEGGVVRWVSNWANVRQGRSLDSPVLEVLPPGRQVVVANRASGFWEVYLEGRFSGYIAGSLLLRELPDTLIPRR